MPSLPLSKNSRPPASRREKEGPEASPASRPGSFGSRPARAAAAGELSGLRIAFVSRKHPFLEASGSASYIRALLEPLAAAGASIHIVVTEVPDGSGSVRFWRDPSDPIPGATLHVRKRFRVGPWHVQRPANPLRLARELKARFTASRSSAVPPPWPEWDRSMDRAEIRFAQRCLARIDASVEIANYSWMAGIWPRNSKSSPDCLRVILTHDVRHLECREGRIQERAGYPRARELDELNRGDVLVAIQTREAQWFQSELAGRTVVTVPIGLAPSWPEPRVPQPGRCLMVGSNNENNARGLRWFLDYVWPVVTAEIPGASLQVCGAVGENPLLENLPAGVVRRGRVDSLEAEYALASVVVAPLVAGSGLKIKVVEAFAHGCAVVGTSVSLDGIQPLHDLLSPRDQPETFARRVITLLCNEAERSATEAAARHLANEVYSPAACLRPLMHLLKQQQQRQQQPQVKK